MKIQRPITKQSSAIMATVQAIAKQVRSEKDAALQELTERLDGVTLKSFLVSPKEWEDAQKEVSPRALEALGIAKNQIEAFHKQQIPQAIVLETIPGIRLRREPRPIDRVGFYIPAGSAPLPSTVLMLGIPSLLAGCPKRILCTPPRKDGTVNPTILAAADLCGIREVYKVGGAQAIAAMAYGTETIPKVDKIFGPGNAWVTQAKILVSQDLEGAACDLPAGPSEVMVIADGTANRTFVAADLLSQAEHGPDSQVILIVTDKDLLQDVQKEIEKQLRTLPRRDIARTALGNSSFLFAEDVAKAIEIANEYAPEHLILQVENPQEWIPLIRNAGSVFLGPWSPGSVGDYASGTNHVLPTYGYARSQGGVSVESFMKQISFQELTQEGLRVLGPTVELLAEIEGLEGHKRAVSIRREAPSKGRYK